MNVFLTGSTGFLGEYLIAQLLKRGHQVFALFRKEAKREETKRFLTSQGIDPDHARLYWLKGDVLEVNTLWPEWERAQPSIRKVDQILHSAASLRFHINAEGEPRRTNLEGAKALWRLTQRKPMQVHLVSTAYVCGLVEEGVVCEVHHPPGKFVNDYDQSKWEAEQVWSGQATILRPGVIVGDCLNGRCTSFTGWYIIAKGGYLMDQFLKLAPAYDRQDLKINVPMNPQATLNLVPVDYVAEAAVRLMEDTVNHNQVFHLTHPDPPTHQWSHEVLCRFFNLGGIRFVAPSGSDFGNEDFLTRMIWNQTKKFYAYFSNNPTFNRTQTDRALKGLRVPSIDEAFTHQLLEYAISKNWGQKRG